MPLPPDVPRPAFRRDLQGTRGLGITFVVVGHFWHWPPVAYAAMDMFFVLSGFLITGILINALPRYGGRFLAVFYLGRIRRLMPAALTVLVLSTLLFYLLTSRERGDLVAADAVLAAVWLVNWRYALAGTDYFAAEASASPLVHYWSLSVEEQFYLVWPLLVLLIVLLARKRRSAEVPLLVGLGTVTVAAFCYSTWHSSADPVGAYYSTLDRTWEFGVGGLVAVLAPRLARLPLWIGVALGWGCTLGLVASLFLLSPDAPFPAPWGLVPVVMTAGVLAGGIDRDTRYLWILDNRPIIYLGDISYSIYLWHLPINLLVLLLFPDRGVTYYVSALSITMALAVATYHLVERPMRSATWLMTPPERARVREAGPRPASERRPGWIALGLTPTLVLSVAVVAPVVLVSSPELVAQQSAVAHSDASESIVAQQQSRIIAALEQTSFPELNPPLASLGTARWLEDMAESGCYDVAEADLERCRFGPVSSPRAAVVVGDSEAIAWMPGIRSALEPMGWSVQQVTRGQCPAWTLPSYITVDRSPFPECEAHHRLVVHTVLDQRPDLIVLANSSLHVLNAGRAGFPDAKRDVAALGIAATLDDLAPSGARVVVLGDPPVLGDLLACKTRFASPESCVRRPDDVWLAGRAGEEDAASAAGVEYVSVSDWFCFESRCPAFIGTTPATVDGSHLTIELSRSLAPLLREALLNRAHDSGPP